MTILGQHHVTAVTGAVGPNLRFYVRVLGLRLVKRTVNQDDLSAYHLFYGNERAEPGTELTFFEWRDTPQRRAGTGEAGLITFRVPSKAALVWWESRFRTSGVPADPIGQHGGRSILPFRDPDGLPLALVDEGDEAGSITDAPDAEHVPGAAAITGLGPVTWIVADGARTLALLTNLLGYRVIDADSRDLEGQAVVRLETGAGGGATEVLVAARPNLKPARGGRGGVHHVAFRVATDTEQREWEEKLDEAGVRSSGVIDRFYFKSLYFREPGGVLFELATDGPGLDADEPLATIGSRLALPPFLEPARERIEKGLTPLPTY